MLLIIGAMQEELTSVIAGLNTRRVKGKLGIEYHDSLGRYLIAISGIGLVNASLTLSHLLSTYPEINQILVLGTAGAISPRFKPGDICYIKRAFYGQVDATIFGYDYGQIPRMPAAYDLVVPNWLIATLPQSLGANIASADYFISDASQLQSWPLSFKVAIDLADMETTAFCQVAYRFQCPISVVKVVSDSLHQKVNSASAFNQSLSGVALDLHALLQRGLTNSGLLN